MSPLRKVKENKIKKKGKISANRKSHRKASWGRQVPSTPCAVPLPAQREAGGPLRAEGRCVSGRSGAEQDGKPIPPATGLVASRGEARAGRGREGPGTEQGKATRKHVTPHPTPLTVHQPEPSAPREQRADEGLRLREILLFN